MDMLTTGDLAKILRITAGSLRVRLSRRPESLPKPALRGRGSRTLWLKTDVEKWLSRFGETESGNSNE